MYPTSSGRLPRPSAKQSPQQHKFNTDPNAATYLKRPTEGMSYAERPTSCLAPGIQFVALTMGRFGVVHESRRLSLLRRRNRRQASELCDNQLSEKQLDALSRHLRIILKELGRHLDPSIPSREELEANESTDPAEKIEAVITNNLVLFRSIPRLQQHHQNFLKVIRKLGENPWRNSEIDVQSYKKGVDSLCTMLPCLQELGTASGRQLLPATPERHRMVHEHIAIQNGLIVGAMGVALCGMWLGDLGEVAIERHGADPVDFW
ncbi:hypothetical protein C8Q76DRAFT_691969 [Earliella scabrosa]|nr:hypothetical protein C8Q76DRAFT_691969 [Earliella scabrosa]